MKKVISVILAALVLMCASVGCTAGHVSSDKPTVIATLFPQYDFARQIAGEHMEVTLLLPPGVESHTYEPTPADIVKINEAKLFIYTGDYMESWAGEIAKSATGGVTAVDCSQGLSLDAVEHDEHDGHDAHEAESAHVHNYDPHIWTDPTMAAVMVENIARALIASDPDNADEYRANADAYTEKLEALDKAFLELTDNAVRHEICFGGRFAMHYFAKRYNLECIAAYDSCSEETEPSAKAVSAITDKLIDDKIPVIYYEELVEPKVARSIAEAAGVETLLLHSCHNVSKEELDAGATYLSLMYQNLENLKAGLY